MTINRIVEYILHTPHNTNRAILIEMLKSLIISYGGTLSPDDPEIPDDPNKDIIYDGGVES